MAVDFELVFQNARTYNQEKSQIYNDANTLDWIFKNSLRQVGPAGVESPKILKEKFGYKKLFPSLVEADFLNFCCFLK